MENAKKKAGLDLRSNTISNTTARGPTRHRAERERTPMEQIAQAAALCSEVTVILAALAMLIKPISNKLVGQYFDLAN